MHENNVIENNESENQYYSYVSDKKDNDKGCDV